MSFFDDIRTGLEAGARLAELHGGILADPFNEIATVVSVSDPKELGRIKVQFQDGIVSDWLYVLGSQTGQISSQFIGSNCLVGKSAGRSENGFVLGFFNKSQLVGINGQPLQIPVVDGHSGPAQQGCCDGNSPGDLGMKCNKANRGRIYVIDDEISQDVIVCLRRNNLQEGEGEVWNWKSLTHSKWIEKGYDPGVKAYAYVPDQSEKKGVPVCNAALEGEIHEFTEDKKFRSFPIICRRDENGQFAWIPASSPPVVFRTNLPTCTEKIHGMEAILDPGDNSQKVVCLRYQGQMKWVTHGKREPIQFHNSSPPISKETFLSSKKPMEPLQKASTGLGALGAGGGDLGGTLLTTLGNSVPLVGANSPINQVVPQPTSFDPRGFLSTAGSIVLSNNIPLELAETFIPNLTQAISSGENISDGFGKILDLLGGAGVTLVNGIQNDDLEQAYIQIGLNAINETLGNRTPADRAVFLSLISSGWSGALDALAISGLEQFPPATQQILSPLVRSLTNILSGQPTSINNIINSPLGLAGELGLREEASGLINLALGQPITQNFVNQISSSLAGGSFGEISQVFNSFSSLTSLPRLPGDFSSLPATMSSITSLVGLGESFNALLGGGGIGLNTVTSLLGTNPVGNILGGVIPSLGLLSGQQDCPCGPKCRKIEHGKDSDGNSLLEPCGNVVANSHSSYAPEGDPTNNNLNPVARLLALLPTGIGEDLCAPNVLDLTQMIQLIKRVGDMANRMEDARNADQPEFYQELMYTFEAIEKALKVTDNNITGIEDVERKLIDTSFRLYRAFFRDKFSYFPLLIEDVKENAAAIRDLQRRVGVLDRVKKGPVKGYKVPTKSIQLAINNITSLPKLKSNSQREANRVIERAIKPADKKWKSLDPAYGLVEIANFVLGAFSGNLPFNFDKCKTKRNKNKILKSSLEAKLNSPIPKNPLSIFEAKLPKPRPVDIDELREANILPTRRPSTIFPILDQIQFESGKDSNC